MEPRWVRRSPDPTRVRRGNTDSLLTACPHVVGVVCSILSDPKVEDKTPFNVMSELLIRADKNQIGGLTGQKVKTIDAILKL